LIGDIMVMKRLMAPEFWPIERKTKKFVVEPLPGPYSKDSCLPLGVVLRDILHYARNMNEVKILLNQGAVKVNGIPRKEPGFGVGLMDVVGIGDEHYRMVPTKHGLRLRKIDKNESGIRLLRLQNKRVVKKGKVQLNFHDGRNILIEKNNYKTGDVFVFDFNESKIKNVISFEKGILAIVVRGNNIGSIGKIEDILVTKSPMENQVVIDLGMRKITLPKSYIFAVGKTEPVISLGETL